jgi:hypothetical protein
VKIHDRTPTTDNAEWLGYLDGKMDKPKREVGAYLEGHYLAGYQDGIRQRKYMAIRSSYVRAIGGYKNG